MKRYIYIKFEVSRGRPLSGVWPTEQRAFARIMPKSLEIYIVSIEILCGPLLEIELILIFLNNCVFQHYGICLSNPWNLAKSIALNSANL